jgi:Predicted thioesterase
VAVPYHAYRSGRDINYGGHLGNDRVLGLAHEARVRWLASHDLSEADVGGAGLIMADAALVFRQEAFLGDVLDVALGAAEARRSSFDLVYLLTVFPTERKSLWSRRAWSVSITRRARSFVCPRGLPDASGSVV